MSGTIIPPFQLGLISILTSLVLIYPATPSELNPIYTLPPPNRPTSHPTYARSKHINITNHNDYVFRRLLELEDHHNHTANSTTIHHHSNSISNHSVQFNITTAERRHRPRSFIPHPGLDLNTVNHFLEFVPLDYENGNDERFYSGRSKKRAAVGGPPPPRNRNNRIPRRPPQFITRRMGNNGSFHKPPTPFKRIINSFHQKVARLLLGPPRRRSGPPPHPSKRIDPSYPRSDSSSPDHPAPSQSITTALNTVAQLIQQHQYIPVVSKTERVRKLSHSESQHLSRKDRRNNRRRNQRRKYPRRYRRPPPQQHYHDDVDHHPDEIDEQQPRGPPRNYKFRGLKYSPFDNGEEEKELSPPPSFKGFKAFRPWSMRFGNKHRHHHPRHHHHRRPQHHYHHDEEEDYEDVKQKPWFAPDASSEEIKEPSYKTRKPHHFSDSHDFFKPRKPSYTPSSSWRKKKSRGKKYSAYDHGESHSYDVKTETEEKIPKIVINHHHNLPPAASAGFMPSTPFSYHHPMRYSEEYYSGASLPYHVKSNEFADSFIVNDYQQQQQQGRGFDMSPQQQIAPGQFPVFNEQEQNHQFMVQQQQQQQQHNFQQQNYNQQFNTPPMSSTSFENGGNNFPNQLLNFPLDIQPQIIDPFANQQQQSQMDRFNPDIFNGGSSASNEGGSSGPPPPPPPHGSLPDASPSTIGERNENENNNDDVGPPLSTASREQFFKFNHPRNNKDRKEFQFSLTKSMSSEVEIPGELPRFSSERLILPVGDPFPPVPPKPIDNIFDLGGEQHYKKKKFHRKKYHHFNSLSNEEPNIEGYSTLPDNWKEFRPDPSHSKLPKLTYDELGNMNSRVYKLKTALTPKGIMKAIMNRFPKKSRAHSKFTSFDAKSVEEEEAHGRKRRKSSKNPHSIQDIIDSDSSNKNVVEEVGEHEDDERKEDGAFARRSSSPTKIGAGVVIPLEEDDEVTTVASPFETEVPFKQEVVVSSISVPVGAEMQMQGK